LGDNCPQQSFGNSQYVVLSQTLDARKLIAHLVTKDNHSQSGNKINQYLFAESISKRFLYIFDSSYPHKSRGHSRIQ
jgi:hypothetical protein